jgi:hypothetical protein
MSDEMFPDDDDDLERLLRDVEANGSAATTADALTRLLNSIEVDQAIFDMLADAADIASLAAEDLHLFERLVTDLERRGATVKLVRRLERCVNDCRRQQRREERASRPVVEQEEQLEQAVLDQVAETVPIAEAQADDLAGLLTALTVYFSRWVWYPIWPHQPRLLALWTVHTYCLERFAYSPRLIVRAPTKRSGKTTVLKLLRRAVLNAPGIEILTTAASVFRSLAKEQITLLIDEIDALFGPKAAGGEDLRGVINHGFEADGIVRRNIPDPKLGYRVEMFPAFCSMALTGIGRLPETIEDRSIVLRLRPKPKGVTVERLNTRQVKRQGTELRAWAASWAKRHGEELIRPEDDPCPEFPAGLDDRAEDCWEPLLLIADLAGGDWPKWARETAICLSGGRDTASDADPLHLLADVRDVLAARGWPDRFWVQELVDDLRKLDDAPWGELNGHGITAWRLTNQLREFEIHSRDVRRGDITRKGYSLADFVPVWNTYLNAESEQGEREKNAEP